MGVVVFPVVEGYRKYHFYSDPDRDWKSLGMNLDVLDQIAEQVQVTPLSNFFSLPTRNEAEMYGVDIEEVEAQGELINGAWYHGGKLQWANELNWFSPGDGLETVRRLLEYVGVHSGCLGREDDEAGVVDNLQRTQDVLVQAQQEGKRFRIHFAG